MKKTRLLTLIFAMMVLLGSGRVNAEEDPEWYLSITNAGNLVAGQNFCAELYFIGEDNGDPNVVNDGKNNLNTYFIDFTYDITKMQFLGEVCYDHFGTSEFDKIYNGCVVPHPENPPGYVWNIMGSELPGKPHRFWPDDGLDPHNSDIPYKHLGTIYFQAKVTGDYDNLGIEFVDRDGCDTLARVDGIKYANPAAFYTWTDEGMSNCSWLYTPPLEVDFSFSPETGDPPLTVSFESIITGGCEPYLSCTWRITDKIPDLVISEKTIVWIDEEGGACNIHCTLANLGGWKAEESHACLYINDNLVETYPCNGVSKNDASDFTFDGTFTYSEGDIIKVCADCENEVEEGNESNNCTEGLYHYEEDCVHTFEQGGTYHITLEVKDNCYIVESKTYQIYVTEPPPPPPPVACFSAAPLRGSDPLEVCFTDESTGAVESWSWDFGDGEISEEQDPVNFYSCRDGQTYSAYTASLSVTGKIKTSSWTRPAYIVVSEAEAAPVADFSADARTGVDELEVEFTDLSAGNLNSWSWDFGDGKTSSEQDPTHTFSLRDGETYSYYTISLEAAGPEGKDVRIKPGHIVVSAQGSRPAADFTGTPRKWCYDGVEIVYLTDLSAGDIDSWEWDHLVVGGTQKNPAIKVGTPGFDNFVLTVTGPGGEEDTKEKSKYTYSPSWEGVAAMFSALPRKGTPPLKVDFSNLSCGPIETWSWHFDYHDGDEDEDRDSTDQHPGHTYHTAGIYTVRLTATTSDGVVADTEEKVGYIVVGATPPAAVFSASPTDGPAPLAVAFTDNSTGSINKRFWDFGDGKTSDEEDPVHEYKYKGAYTVKLTVVGYDEYNTEEKVNYIVVAPPPLEADFDYEIDEVDPLKVEFTDKTTGGVEPYGYEWDLDYHDGDEDVDSSQSNPVHTYSESGSYTVRLMVTDSYSPPNTDTITRDIEVTGELEKVADPTFSPSETTFTDSLQVEISCATEGVTIYYTTDGADPTENSTEYTGPITITETTTIKAKAFKEDLDPSETAEATYTKTIPALAADFSADPASGPPPLAVSFADATTGGTPPYAWEWDFDNNGEVDGVDQNPAYEYTDMGDYTVSLKVTDSEGNEDTEIKTGYIKVTEPPVADFFASPRSGVAPLTVNFTDFSTGDIESWSWNFGGGVTSSEQNPVYTYSRCGAFAVSLSVNWPGGSNTRTKELYISVLPPQDGGFYEWPWWWF